MDVTGILKALQQQKPPLECPVCQKIYRSFSGISYHVVKNHSGGHCETNFISSEDALVSFSPKEKAKKKPLSYADAQRMVEFDLKGSVIRELICEPLSIEVMKPEIQNTEIEPETKLEIESPLKTPTKTPSRGTPKRRGRGRGRYLLHYKQRQNYTLVKKALHGNTEEKKIPLPVAVVNILPSEENLQSEIEERSSYFRYIDKSAEELDEEVEYGMDEEDYIWLDTINIDRKENSLAPISGEVFEMLLDRLEKESHFETRTVTGDPYNLIDEDAVCSICCDGECSNSNGILFCDMCNLAVHQECYGVPYIPEGQWLCRKCLQSPSKPVDCALCPTKSGAFKQTDTNAWAHVVCALWIPEVCFANTVFLEPIDSISNIPAARWKLVCYICKKKTGACIQCFKTNCYTAFHVTCAQQGGLYMKIEAAGRLENGQPTIKKSAYCDAHTPKNIQNEFGTPTHSDCEASDNDSDTASINSKSSAVVKSKAAAYQTPSAKLKEVQKKLLEKQSFKLPAVHIPFVPAHRLSKIVANVAIAKKSQFIQQLQSYWMLKRQSRNGVPLLRRLQANTGSGINRNQQKEHTLEEWSQSKELKEQLRYWQQLRHDLERARLLIELIRKREKIKKQHYLKKQQIIEMQLKPLQLEMERTIEFLQERDTTGIFGEPVKPEDAPDYHEFVPNPMDFQTMRHKLTDYEYLNFDLFEVDFNLIIQNCLSFNQEDTIYYRTALRMRAQCKPIIKAARKRIKQAGIDPQTGMHMEKPPVVCNGEERTAGDLLSPTEGDVAALLENPFMSIDEKLEDLELKLDISATIKNALSRLSRQKMLRKEIAKLKRQKRTLDLPSSAEGDISLNSEETPSHLLLKRRGKKRRKLRIQNNYNGDVKIPPSISENIDIVASTNSVEANENINKELKVDENVPVENRVSPPNHLDIDEASSLTNQVTTPTTESGESVNDRLSPIFLEPAEIVRNPSPGRSRRSGILFKKKTYKPLKPSPLVIYSSTTTSDDEGTNPSIKLRLQLTSLTNPNTRINSENYDPNICYLNRKTNTRRNSSKTNLSISTSPTPRTNGHDKHITNGYTHDVISDECFDDVTDSEYVPSSDTNTQSSPTSNGHRTRKRTYTSSSDSEGNIHLAKRKLNKRGRQKEKLSLQNLEGLSDIKYGVYMVNNEETNLLDPKIHPEAIDFLALIWAKCKGYPSYPALTINPSIPRSGYQSNGVPIPIPPLEVLHMKHDQQHYLILFFDARRTWQWLPRDKVEPLGIDSRLDEVRLIESKKPSMRKNVQEAYKRAIAFRQRLEVGENSDEEHFGANDSFMNEPVAENGGGAFDESMEEEDDEEVTLNNSLQTPPLALSV